MLLGTNKFWKKKSLISTDGSSTEVWKILSTGKLTQVVDDEKLACYWNVLVCSSFASNNAVLKIDDVEVSIDNIKLKEYVHIRTGIAEYAERVARKSENLVSAPAPTILASKSLVVMAPFPIPTIPATVEESLAAPSVIPLSDPLKVNRKVAEKKISKKRVRSELPPSDFALIVKKGKNEKCPECKEAQHKPGCAFLAWKKDNHKSECVVRERNNGVQETIHEAHRRFWLKNASTLRLKYISLQPTALNT